MTEDGGMAESLNMYIDTTENAPALVPEDVTAKLGLRATDVDYIFVHKTPNYENVITIESNTICAYIQGTKKSIVDLPTGEKFAAIASIGNTIVVSTENAVMYILWKNNSYVYIGDNIPIPVIQIEALEDKTTFETSKGGKVFLDINKSALLATFDESTWKEAAKGLNDNPEVNSYLETLRQELWASIQKTKNKISKWGYFSCPRFVRYAVKLYDGSYVYHSVPILIGPGEKEWVTVQGSAQMAGMSLLTSSLDYMIRLPYKATAKLIKWDVEGWEDIISGVDIFISTDITTPNINAEFETIGDNNKICFKGYNKEETARNEVLSKTNFYLVSSHASRSLGELKRGVDLHENDFVEESESLVVRERLTYDYMSNHKLIPGRMSTFNNRLLSDSTKIKLPDTYPLLNGLFCNGSMAYSGNSYGVDHQEQRQYQFRFFIRKNGVEYSVLGRSHEGGFIFNTPKVDNGLPSNMNTSFYADPMAWIAYPDPDCYKVEMKIGDSKAYVQTMEQHPGLYCSYAFIGMDKFYSQVFSDDMDREYETVEDRIYQVSNKVILSQVDNPFVFPAEGHTTIMSKILGTAAITTALSEGQFGKFSLYVFTDDGINAFETADDGTFKPSTIDLPRHVCTNPKSIKSIDSAVAFVTNQGVMLIQGSQVRNISPYMNGRHYTVENGARTIIEGQECFRDLLPIITDTTHFLKFVKQASVAYDYAGQRLIFINEEEKYQYVYKIDTDTWHKVAFADMSLVQPINSYPESLVRGIQGTDDITMSRVVRFNNNGSQLSIDEQKTIIKNNHLYGNYLDDSFIEDALKGITAIDVSGWSEDDYDALVDRLDDEHIICTDSLEKCEKITALEPIENPADNIVALYTNLLNIYYGSQYASKIARGFICGEYSLPTYGLQVEKKKTLLTTLKNFSAQVNVAPILVSPDSQIAKVYSLSTILDAAEGSQETAKGILVTRPFDLGEPDVFKTITDIRVRGQFPKGAVKFILLGSNDGINFATVSTLRGRSWKLFRMIILADLAPTERISWVDIMYDTRFTNKLR